MTVTKLQERQYSLAQEDNKKTINRSAERPMNIQQLILQKHHIEERYSLCKLVVIDLNNFLLTRGDRTKGKHLKDTVG